MKDQAPALPGLEALVKPVVDRPGAEDMSDPKRYTAEIVMRDYPLVAQQVARALFYHRLTITCVADCFRMSKATVSAIRDRVLAEATVPGAPSFFIKSRTRSQRDIVLAKIMDEIDDRLSNPARIDSITTKELLEFAVKLEGAKPATNGTEPIDAQPVNADEFDQAIADGLDAQKNGAPILGVDRGDAGDERGEDAASTDALGNEKRATEGAGFSFQMSHDVPDLQGDGAARCNSRCNSGGMTAVLTDSLGRPAADRAPAPAALEGTPGGAGVGAPAARGGLT